MAQTEGVFLLHMKSKSSMPCNIQATRRSELDQRRKQQQLHEDDMQLLWH